MPSVCTIEKCQRSTDALCYVCEKSFCREHFDQHDHSFNLLLKSFNDRINDLNKRLENFNNEELIENSYEKIDQWREQSYKTIDRFYEQKCQEIQRSFQENINRQQEKIDQLHSQVIQLLQQENITQKTINLFKSDLINLEEEIKKFEQIKFQIEIHPLELDRHCINIDTTHFYLQKISRPYQTIDCSNQSLATNNQYLLIYRKKNLCLINRELNLIKQIPWKFGRIWDMCWSDVLNRFIIVAHYEIYLIDQDKMSIESIQTIPRRNWWSCTCSNRSLFLSTYEHGSTIMEFSLKPSIQLIQQWTSPITCNKEEFIKDIVYKNDKIALTIYNQKYLTKRIELRTINQFKLLWSLQLDSPGECYNTLRICSINENQWLVTDFNNQCLFHITDNGYLKTIYSYHVSPWYVNLFNSNILIISTKKTLNFHKL
jgi:hypothetical protein